MIGLLSEYGRHLCHCTEVQGLEQKVQEEKLLKHIGASALGKFPTMSCCGWGGLRIAQVFVPMAKMSREQTVRSTLLCNLEIDNIWEDFSIKSRQVVEKTMK